MSEVISEDDQLRAKLDELGEEEVRKRFVRGDYGERKSPIVVDWLAQQSEKRQTDAQERQEIREDEALVLARRADKHAYQANESADEANRIAWIANRNACIAAVIAVVAIIISVAVSVFK
jgi:hypothetical protein